MRLTYLRSLLSVLLLLFFILFATGGKAEDLGAKSIGQTVYVPAYSHIYHGNREAQLLLSVTLSIRNIDLDNPLVVSAVDYYDTQGKLLKHFIAAPVSLGPLGSERYVISQDDSSGGSGANFIVVWKAKKPTNPPIIESVMIGSQSQLGVSFTSRGQALQP